MELNYVQNKIIFFLLVFLIIFSFSCLKSKNNIHCEKVKFDNNQDSILLNAIYLIKKFKNIEMCYEFGKTEPSNIYKQFLILEKNASFKKLILLMFDKNPNIKSYSFLAYRNKGGNILPLLFAKVDDTSIVKINFASLTDYLNIGVFYYYSIKRFDPILKIDTIYLTNKQLDSLDNYILNNCKNKELIKIVEEKKKK